MLEYIVTGTGRCGTVFMAKTLTDLGIPCGHESIFDFRSEESIFARVRNEIKPSMSECMLKTKGVNPDPDKLVADSSYMAVPYLNHPEIKTIPLIHVVRNPLKVISSFVKDFKYFQDLEKNPYNTKNWEQWIYSQCPELQDIENPVERAAAYYFEWNSRIGKCREDRPYFFWRIEDTPFRDGFFKFLNVPKKDTYSNTKANSHKKRSQDFMWSDIPDGPTKYKLKRLASKYGYLNQFS